MRTFSILTGTVLFGLILSGCTSPMTNQTRTEIASNYIRKQNVVKITPDYYPAKDAKTVGFYEQLHTLQNKPYKVIGVATVSKYNVLGVKREPDTVHTMLKTLAASIGGDGLINIYSSNSEMQASVIAFQNANVNTKPVSLG
jgi:hypothetical protein